MRPDVSSITPATVAQWRIEPTMFLPTPKRAMASGPEKTYLLSSWPSLSCTASKAFFNHP